MPAQRALLLSLLVLASFGLAALNADEVKIPAGTRIDVELARPLRSDSVMVGDTFEATVSAPVRVAGRIVVPAGAAVEGRVTVVKSLARSGVIGVRFARLRTADGRTYDIDGVLAPTRDGEAVAVSPSKKEAVVLIGNEADAPGKRASTLVGDVGEEAEGLAERGSRSGLSPRLALAQEGTGLTIELREPVEVAAAPAAP
jgi:hypothetical protein